MTPYEEKKTTTKTNKTHNTNKETTKKTKKTKKKNTTYDHTIRVARVALDYKSSIRLQE